MAISGRTPQYECDFCGEEFYTEDEAEEHVKDEHDDDVLEEEWPRYVSEV